MRKLSKAELIRRLKQEGLRFSEMSLISEGDYTPDDADWNYKDVPHLHHVHELAEAYPALIDDDVICSVNMQKILFLWFPITLVNYEFSAYRQVYFTTLFFFVLVIETVSESVGPLRTRVTTNYSIGYPKWLGVAAPILKWLIRRNYNVLMAADIPMRERRGELRKLGYRFEKKGETYSFEDTLNVSKSNLLPPKDVSFLIRSNYFQELSSRNETFIGDSGLLGVRLLRRHDEVIIFPRACPHEGALLDTMPCDAENVRCYWHGRLIRPIGRFSWGKDSCFSTEDYRVEVLGEQITVEFLYAQRGGATEPAGS